MQSAKIHKVPLREIWKREDKDFSAWLEENIDDHNGIFEFDISVESREEAELNARVLSNLDKIKLPK